MKKKLLICFRPVTIETDDDSTEPITRSEHRVSKLLTITNKRYTEARSENLKITRHSRSINDSSRQDLKSILVETSLQRQRACDRNIDPLMMLRSMSHDYPKLVDLNSCSPRSISERKEDCLSSSLNKSLSGSSGSLSKLFNQKKQIISDDKIIRWNSGLVLFVTTLCVTVFWGRVCGILFMSILLYFLPRRTCTDRRSENVSKVAETEKEYKKRVIMEGLLERNNHHRY